jgi:dGTPase
VSARARVVSDFIAGMTDPYAIEQHARLCDGAGPLR